MQNNFSFLNPPDPFRVDRERLGGFFPHSNAADLKATYSHLRSFPPNLSKATNTPLTLEQHHHVLFPDSEAPYRLQTSHTQGVYVLRTEPGADVMVEVHGISSAFLSLELAENSTLHLSFPGHPPTRFLFIHCALAPRARLELTDRWRGKESWTGFYGDLADYSSVRHIQRMVAEPGRHFSAAQFVVPNYVNGADVEQSVKVIKTYPDAKVELYPWLWIGNRHVTAKHGAAVGTLDPAALNYLQARGVPLLQAEALLVNAFLDIDEP